MSFPKVPLVTGDTDDDASIHLNAFVGKANPLPRSTSENRRSGNNFQRADDDINTMFRRFQETGTISLGENEDRDSGQELGGQSGEKSAHYVYNGDDDDEDEDADYDYKDEANEVKNDTGTDDGELSDELSDSDEDLSRNEAQKYTSLKNRFRARRAKAYFDDDSTKTSRNRENTSHSRAYDYDSESDEDYVYSESDSDAWSLDSETTNVEDATVERVDKPKIVQSAANWTIALQIAVVAGGLILLVVFLPLFFASRYDQVDGPDSIPRLTALQRRLGDLARRHDQLQASLDDHSLSIASKFEYISTKFDELDSKLQAQPWSTLQSEVEQLKETVRRGNIDTTDSKLAELDEKLDKITTMYDTFEGAKNSVVADFISKLPEKVPAYIQDNKIHFAPEFHRYLLAFIDNYHQQKGNQTWSGFLDSHSSELNAYLTSALKRSNAVTREVLEETIHKRLADNNQIIWDKFNGLVDTLAANSTSLNVAADGVMLESILDVFAKSSKSVNYADYQLGSRILGFLTSAGTESQKSLVRRVLLGWYDYLNGPSAPSSWKFNANSVLVDDGNSWQCGPHCSVGIRLFDSVLLTDLVLHSNGASAVSVYVKPRYSKDFDKVQKYASRLKFVRDELENKYARKFIKVKEANLVGNVNHIHMPRSVVNMEVPVRDIIVEVFGDDAKVESLKAYGVKEVGGRQLRQDFGAQIQLGEDIVV
ncbi:hypothetical protein JA9_004927 [Meyerozyma sp. JA9]|nr:hypothetical protein JA9_004927 [Meyerozyma sp. JA9]